MSQLPKPIPPAVHDLFMHTTQMESCSLSVVRPLLFAAMVARRFSQLTQRRFQKLRAFNFEPFRAREKRFQPKIKASGLTRLGGDLTFGRLLYRDEHKQLS